jgi:methionyl-tRNA synthetase
MTQNMKTFYLTTPLYYVNDVPHIGHAYTTVATDVLARWKRLCGEKVFFLTGTDEHGSKISEAAAKVQMSPFDYATKYAIEFQRLWTVLGISNDDFIRTTEERHRKVVQFVFSRLEATGDIYPGTYSGWYCTPCESFYAESDLKGGKCPTCGRAVEILNEDSYFFRLSRHQGKLLKYYEENPDFLQPRFRAQEIINFVKEGLKDLSVSRTRVSWGIPAPNHPGHTVYVWFDALLNYIAAANYSPSPDAGRGNHGSGSPLGWPVEGVPEGRGEGKMKFEDVWPADVHIVGKEIFRFHAVIWPAMLMALKLPLPKKVFAHGWWTVEGQKMSKSLGNVVDPHKVCDEYGVDAFRYFLLREVPFGGDGDFSQGAVLNRYNAELANALGNLLSRTLTLVMKHFQGDLPSSAYLGLSLLSDLKSRLSKIQGSYDRLAYHEALDETWSLVFRTNKYIDEQAPWKLGPADKEKLSRILAECSSVLQALAIFLAPLMPDKSAEMWRQLGRTDSLAAAARALLKDGVFHPESTRTVQKGEPLFPRKGRWK